METIYDFMRLACDDGSTEITVYDLNESVEDNVYEGEYKGIPVEYDDMEVMSWELLTRDGESCICFNVDTSR